MLGSGAEVGGSVGAVTMLTATQTKRTKKTSFSSLLVLLVRAQETEMLCGVVLDPEGVIP